MRIVPNTLTIMAASLLAVSPLAAQAKPQMTMEESAECMVAIVPFMMVAIVFDTADAESLMSKAEFWATQADSFGDPGDAHMAKIDAETEAMFARLETVETEADRAAFVAPYQATFDACEEKRKAMQAG